MAAEKSVFGIAMTDNEGNLFKGVHCFSLLRNWTTSTSSVTPSDSRKGFYYNANIANWETWMIGYAGGTIPMTDPFLIVVDEEGL